MNLIRLGVKTVVDVEEEDLPVVGLDTVDSCAI